MNRLAVPVELLCFSDDVKYKEQAISRNVLYILHPSVPFAFIIN